MMMNKVAISSVANDEPIKALLDIVAKEMTSADTGRLQ